MGIRDHQRAVTRVMDCLRDGRTRSSSPFTPPMVLHAQDKTSHHRVERHDTSAKVVEGRQQLRLGRLRLVSLLQRGGRGNGNPLGSQVGKSPPSSATWTAPRLPNRLVSFPSIYTLGATLSRVAPGEKTACKIPRPSSCAPAPPENGRRCMLPKRLAMANHIVQ